MTRVAIMQPYFIPYAGYFRLFCDIDLFVVLDNVQFPREGWVHRNRLVDQTGRLSWLTLPLRRGPLTTRIHELRFSPDGGSVLAGRLRRFRLFGQPSQGARQIAEAVQQVGSIAPVDYLCRLLEMVGEVLGVRAPTVRASTLRIPPHLAGQQRVLAICEWCKATTYVNAPGGRNLYDPGEFARRGIRLEFLPTYRGSAESILQRLNDQPATEVSAEIRANLVRPC